jgi:protein O-mannosyl-transferase
MTDEQKKFWIPLALIALATLAVYVNTFGHGFVWDDTQIIVENPMLRSLRNIPRLLFMEDRFAEASSGYYRPVTYLSFALDHALWGLNALGYNLSNLLLHMAAAMVFYRLLLAIFARENLALVAALLFALHPVAGETVNFHAGGRNTLLCACFALSAFLFHIGRKQWPALAFFTLAIFSKEFALLLPVVLFSYDRFLRREARSWTSYLPYLLSIAGYLTCRSLVVEKANPISLSGLSDRLLTIPRIAVHYLFNMVLPVDLKTIYDVGPTSAAAALGYAALLAAAVVPCVLFRKRAEVAASYLWFFLFLLPVSNLIPLGSAQMADRYVYFSLMGFCLGAAFLICQANRKTVLVIAAAICSCFAAVDVQRNHYWQDDGTFFTRATQDSPELVVGYLNLGVHYFNTGDLVNAEKYLSLAYAKNSKVSKTVHTLLSVYWETGNLGKAAGLMTRAMEANPADPEPYIMLHRIYRRSGDQALAESYHARAVALFPQVEEMMTARAATLCKEGEQLVAEKQGVSAQRKFQAALLMNAGFVPALIDLGSLAAEKGDLPRAVDYFAQAASLAPSNPMAHYNLAVAYGLLGRKPEADSEMKRYQELEKAGGVPGP